MVRVRKVADHNDTSSLKIIETKGKCPEANRIIRTLLNDEEPEKLNCQEYRDAERLEFQSPVEKDVVLTARSLFLNQNISTFVKDLSAETWNVGNYITDLQFTPAVLRDLKGKRILDLAGGAGLFPEEAMAFGAKVDVIDLNAKIYLKILADEYKEKIEYFKLKGLKNCADFIRFLYVRNLEIMHCQNQTNNFLGDYTGAFEQIFDHRFTIAREIHSGRCSRVEGDATKLEGVKDDSYDMVLNCWMLNYLTNVQRLAVVREVVRVTKPGGQIRLQGGHEDADGSEKTPELNLKNEKYFPSLDLHRLDFWAEKGMIEKVAEGKYAIGKKLVEVGKESEGTFLLLHVL